MTYRGRVEGRTILLDEPLPYPDGQRVAVDVAPEARAAPGARGISPAALLAAMHKSPHVDAASVDDLDAAIEAGRTSVQFNGEFDGAR